jgi:hypothetical protein
VRYQEIYNMSRGTDHSNRLAIVSAMAIPAVGVAFYAARRFWTRSATTPAPSAALPLPTSDPMEWTAGEVRAWLQANGVSADVIEAFAREDVDGATLPVLSDQALIDMGITKLGHRARVLRSIRTVLGMPVDTPRDSAVGTPAVSPSASLARDQRRAPPAATRRHADPAAAPDESDDGDVVMPGGLQRSAEEPALTRREQHSGGAEIGTVAGKMRAWLDVLTSEQFGRAGLEQRHHVVLDAARELSAIAKALDAMPSGSPAVQNLKDHASQLLQVITAANEAIERERDATTTTHTKSPSRGGGAAAAAASATEGQGPHLGQDALVKVMELLEQFQSVLTSPDILSIPAEQRLDITSGIAQQLSRIRETIVPRIAEPHRRALADSVDVLLSIATKLQDPTLQQQVSLARDVPPAQRKEVAREAARQAAAEAQTLARGGQPPTPASLNFIVQRMRQIFDEIKHPDFFGEQDPLKLRDRVDGTARQVHALAREGDHLPVQDREVVKQVADNILSVLDKISETVQARALAMQTEQQVKQARAAQAGRQQQQQPVSPQTKARQQQQQQQTADPASGPHDIEIAQLLSKQLVAMLNVLKSDNFEQASARQRGAVAARMKQDLESVSGHLTRQPADVRQLLAPTRDKLLEFLNAILETAVASEAQEQRQAGAGAQPQGRNVAAASTATNGAATANGSAPSAAFLQLNSQLKEIVTIVRSLEFKSQPNAKKLDVIVQCQQLLGSLVQRVAPLPPAEKEVAMHNAGQVNQLLKAIADPLVDENAVGDEEGDEPAESDSAADEGETSTEQAPRVPPRRSNGNGAITALEVVQRIQGLFNSINADDFLDVSAGERDEKAAELNQELLDLTELTEQLSESEQASIIPLLNSLAGVLGKLTASMAGDEEGDTDDASYSREESTTDAGMSRSMDSMAQSQERQDILKMAKDTTAALASGRLRITTAEGIEQLSQLLTLVDGCKVRTEEEVRIREAYQMAVERVIRKLSDDLEAEAGGAEDMEADEDEDEEAEDDEDDDEPASPSDVAATSTESAGQDDQLGSLLQTITEALQVANTEQELEPVLPHLIRITNSTAWRENPRHVKLLANAMKLIEQKRAEFAVRGNNAPLDLSTFKAEMRAIAAALQRAGRHELPALMNRLTTATDASDRWKADAQAVALVNNAIRAIQEATRRIEPSGVEDLDESAATDSDASGAEAGAQSRPQASRLAVLLRDAAARVRAGEDPARYIALGVDISKRRQHLLPEEQAALAEFEASLAEASRALSPDTPAGQKYTPPNTPASVPSGGVQSRNNSTEFDDDSNTGSPAAAAAAARGNVEAQMLEVLKQVKARVESTSVASFQDVAPYVSFLSKLRQGNQLTPAAEKAAREVEDMIRERVAALKTKGEDLRAKAAEMKQAQMRQMVDILTHPSFKNLDPETRTTTIRRGTALLSGLSSMEQESLRNDATHLIAALEDATSQQETENDTTSEALALSDMTILPRILDRLSTADFMAECSVFEIAAIARVLSRLDDHETITNNKDFATLVHQATQMFAERTATFQGSAKNAKSVSSPLLITGMQSESTDDTALTRYTIFSPEENEDYTVNESIAARFQHSLPPNGEAKLPEGGVEPWRARSAALLFCFESSPRDANSTNPTAQSEVTDLADVLETQHGFEVFRCHDEPTPTALTEAFAALGNENKLERLFIYVQNPVVKTELPPAPQHVIIFRGGDVVKYNSVLKMALNHANNVVLYHDNGNGVEVMAANASAGISQHIGASVTEAAYLVSNASRCWLFDGLVTPTLLEALSIGNRTLCAEDLVNTFVRTVSGKDGADGPHITTSEATAAAFFAPGLASE